MLQLEPHLIANLIGRDLIAFGTGGLGKITIPYLAQEPDIKLHGVTNSRVTAEDAGTFLNTGLPIRSLDTWAKLRPDATILLCVVRKNEESARAACEAAGFHKIMVVPFDLVEMLQDLYNPGRLPTGHPMLYMMCMANELREVHRAAFAEFKGCHRGQTVAVVATGPTLNDYTPVKGIPHVGVNSSFLKEGLHLDYYFLRHYVPEWVEKLRDYDFVKFFSRIEVSERLVSADRFPEYVIEEQNPRRFFPGEPYDDFHTDITSYPLMGGYSIIFQAIQFAIFTRPKRLLLIGCDCAVTGHFDGVSMADYYLPANQYVAKWSAGYQKLKVFIDQFYPDMEVISVNPVGLKGLFHNMYTESHLAAHPELNREECEIFDPADFEAAKGFPPKGVGNR